MRKCPKCDGTGEVVVRKARQMGYTIAPTESADVLEERIIPCPVCKPEHKGNGHDNETG